MYRGLPHPMEGQCASRLSSFWDENSLQQNLRESTPRHLNYAKTYDAQLNNVEKCEQEVCFFPTHHFLSTFTSCVRNLKHFFISDANTIPCQTLAHAYMRKIFSNDRSWHLPGDHMRGGANPPINIPEVHSFVNVTPKPTTEFFFVGNQANHKYTIEPTAVQQHTSGYGAEKGVSTLLSSSTTSCWCHASLRHSDRPSETIFGLLMSHQEY